MRKVFTLGNIITILMAVITMGTIVFASGQWREKTLQNCKRIECIENRERDREERERKIMEKINRIDNNITAIKTYMELKSNYKLK